MKRSLLAVIVALIAGVAVFGAAATLGLRSQKLDTFGNNLAATTSTSQSAPTFTAISDDDTSGDGDGKFENGDILFLQVSAPLDAIMSGLPKTNVSVVLNDPIATGNNETVTATGVFQPATVPLDSDGFLQGTGPKTATFAGSTVRLQSGNATIIELVLGTCSGACGNNDLKKASTTTTFTLDSSFKTAAGVSVVGSVSKTDYTIF